MNPAATPLGFQYCGGTVTTSCCALHEYGDMILDIAHDMGTPAVVRRGVFYLLFPPRTRLKKGHKSGSFLMSSMRFLAVKWGFKARHRGDDHDYCVFSTTHASLFLGRRHPDSLLLGSEAELDFYLWNTYAQMFPSMEKLQPTLRLYVQLL